MTRCANGSDLIPCDRQPEFTLRLTDADDGRWLGTICGPCAANIIEAGEVRRSTSNAFRIVVNEKGGRS